jgi:hypothetical protein
MGAFAGWLHHPAHALNHHHGYHQSLHAIADKQIFLDRQCSKITSGFRWLHGWQVRFLDLLCRAFVVLEQ